MKKILILCFLFGWGEFLSAQSPISVAGTPTISAVTSGNWTDPNTWGGNLPATDDRILIPDGIVVSLDAEIEPPFKSLSLQGGTLRFATDVNTELRVEYLVSNPTGRLEVGSRTAPIASDVTAQLVFADRGGTTPAEDPERFAPGAVLMGPVEMRGSEKTSWTTLQVQPEAGASRLVLERVPVGWAVGDRLVVAGTEFGNFTSDELVTIGALDGNAVELDRPLERAHQAPLPARDLAVHVANLSRNVRIVSENQSVSAKRRGHLMFMHHLEVDLRYVELDHLGRTDKSIPLDDYIWDDLQEDPSYDPPRGAYTNPRGRYSIHFHRGGFDPALTPAHVEGVTVNNDPGWAFTNHSSRVDFIRNVAYDVLGSAFCTESGDETGSFVENIALRTVNPLDPLAVTDSELALVDIREEFQDFAWQGCAYWFHSAGIRVVGNVASGVSGHAYIYWTEGLIEKGLGMRRADPKLHITDPAQRASLAGLPEEFVLECWLIPSQPFQNNVAYNVSKGLSGYYIQTRFLDENEEKYNIPTEAYRNTLNIEFDGFTAWNIRNKGIEMVYTSDATIKNCRIVGYGSPATAIGMDLDHWHNLDDWFFFDNTVEGFNNDNVGFATPLNARIEIAGGTFDNSATDIRIRETNYGVDLDDDPFEIGTLGRTMTIADLTFAQPNRNLVLAPDFTLAQEAQDGIDFPDEPKYPFYFLMNDEITLDYGPFQNVKLYFDQQAPDFIPIDDGNYQLEVPPGDPPSDVIIPERYRHKTNAELQALTSDPSTSFGGELLPATALGHPSIEGGKVGQTTTGLEQPQLGTTHFQVSPNPSNGRVDIRGERTLTGLQVLSLRGQVLVDQPERGQTAVLDLGTLPPGLYVLRLWGADFSEVHKLLRQ
ncbi:MAG: G8 domain-containing protein [Bacteroidota bacterium]